ncbi:hypothetical protein NIES4071_56590 [Calothrix sp. NIES-4071]|nr:hypothetical protein NIES4071_56590 [Calothrix sp. NIES-4071]BAZ59966.1 hypothetical protein NIES4105_56540 [Calothrix sp. NIES-4105]
MSQMTRDDVRERLGNIDQIRDIIFGTQIRDYDNRFNKVEKDISLIQQEMRAQFEQLKTNFSAELKAATEIMDKKLKTLSSTTQEEAADLRQQLDRLNRKFSSSFQALDEELDTQTNSIREELLQTKGKLHSDIALLRDLVLRELEERFGALTEDKVSKEDIAETLFALGMRIKGTEFIPKLREAGDDNGYKSLPFIDSSTSKALKYGNGNGSTAEIHV